MHLHDLIASRAANLLRTCGFFWLSSRCTLCMLQAIQIGPNIWPLFRFAAALSRPLVRWSWTRCQKAWWSLVVATSAWSWGLVSPHATADAAVKPPSKQMSSSGSLAGIALRPSLPCQPRHRFPFFHVVWARLGAKVTVVEFLDNIVPTMVSPAVQCFPVHS